MEPSRAERLGALMEQRGYDALLCRLPEHVLAFTGYLPLLGNTFCLVTRDRSGTPEVRLAVPTDEAADVPHGAAVELETFTQASLSFIGTTMEAVRGPLQKLLSAAGVRQGKVGIEGVQRPVVPAYTQVGTPGLVTVELLRSLLSGATVVDASGLLDDVVSVKTAQEVERIRQATRVGGQGLAAGREAVREGATEADVAAAIYAGLVRAGYTLVNARQVLPNVHVMAGPRAAEAYRDANLTSNAIIKPGMPVNVQLEVGVDGYWCELTRAFFAKDADDLWRRVHAACVRAQDAALDVIKDGVTGKEADAVARRVMTEAGFGANFKHGLGHGFGFQAINLNAEPILHPQSPSVLRSGMVHNIEPAAYFDGQGGFRLNDSVHVREDGNERLSAMVPRELDWLVVA